MADIVEFGDFVVSTDDPDTLQLTDDALQSGQSLDGVDDRVAQDIARTVLLMAEVDDLAGVDLSSAGGNGFGARSRMHGGSNPEMLLEKIIDGWTKQIESNHASMSQIRTASDLETITRFADSLKQELMDDFAQLRTKWRDSPRQDVKPWDNSPSMNVSGRVYASNDHIARILTKLVIFYSGFVRPTDASGKYLDTLMREAEQLSLFVVMAINPQVNVGTDASRMKRQAGDIMAMMQQPYGALESSLTRMNEANTPSPRTGSIQSAWGAAQYVVRAIKQIADVRGGGRSRRRGHRGGQFDDHFEARGGASKAGTERAIAIMSVGAVVTGMVAFVGTYFGDLGMW